MRKKFLIISSVAFNNNNSNACRYCLCPAQIIFPFRIEPAKLPASLCTYACACVLMLLKVIILMMNTTGHMWRSLKMQSWNGNLKFTSWKYETVLKRKWKVIERYAFLFFSGVGFILFLLVYSSNLWSWDNSIMMSQVESRNNTRMCLQKFEWDSSMHYRRLLTNKKI